MISETTVPKGKAAMLRITLRRTLVFIAFGIVIPLVVFDMLVSYRLGRAGPQPGSLFELLPVLGFLVHASLFALFSFGCDGLRDIVGAARAAPGTRSRRGTAFRTAIVALILAYILIVAAMFIPAHGFGGYRDQGVHDPRNVAWCAPIV
jgi:hypothetical protein